MSDKRDEIKKRLNRVFQRVFDDDKIEIFEEMTAKDIAEWDSLMHVILVVAIEKEFNAGRFWDLLAKERGEETKKELQDWISRNNLSSHMAIIARK